MRAGRGLISRDLKNNGEATIGETTWVVKDLHAINRTCSADEGGLFITQLEESFLFFNPPQLLGQWQASSCGPNFVARVFRAPERAFSPEESCDVTTCGTTINNALTVKAFDDVFYISTMGYLSIAKFPGGPFVNQTFGSGVRPSGVRFNYTANSFKLQVPTIGFMLVDILPLVRGGTFPSFYIYNTNFCESLEIAGLCRSNTTTVTWDQFLFQAGESCKSTNRQFTFLTNFQSVAIKSCPAVSNVTVPRRAWAIVRVLLAWRQCRVYVQTVLTIVHNF